MFYFVAATALALASPEGCTPVAGADRLWADPVRWVVIGETHGTKESPEAFADLVCLAAASGRPVTVALEYSQDWQGVINAWLASDGGAAARAALLKLPIWRTPAVFQDGRGSRAFLDLLERLRRMKKAGRLERVVCSDIATTAATEQRDAAMAARWTGAARTDRDIVLVLVGSTHARRIPWTDGQKTFLPAGSLLPAAHTITVRIVGTGGTAWNCQEDGCREHRLDPSDMTAPGIVFAGEESAPWNATYTLGHPMTASPPAIFPH